MYISKDIIDEIQNTLLLEDVVVATGYSINGTGRSKGIERCLKCGRDWTHIKINSRKNLFRCMSPNCGWAGNIYNWIMEANKVSFVDAVSIAATMINMDISPSSEIKQYNIQKFQCHKEVISFYSRFTHEYLTHRGITKEFARNEKIGYAPGGNILKKHLNQIGYSDEFLSELRLIRKVNGTYLDSFFKRIVFPIYYQGKVVDIYGRSVTNVSKHFYLYGHNIIDGIDQLSNDSPPLLLEGFFDKAILKQAGLKNTICTGGAGKFNEYHLNKLKTKNIKDVFIGYDTGDTSGAGQCGAIKAGLLLKEHGINSKVVQMPTDIDPNEFLDLYSIVEYKALLNNAMPFEKYYAFHLLSNISKELIEEYLLM